MRHNVAPGGNLDLHAQVFKDASHVGDGLLQGQVLAFDKGLGAAFRLGHQQCLGVRVQVLDGFNLEGRAGLDHFFHGAAVDRAQDALAVFLRNVLGQFHGDLEDLVVAVFRVHDVVLGQADILGGNVPCQAVDSDKVGCTQGRGGQEVVERAGRRAVALVANRLVRYDGEIVKLGFKSEVLEKVDVDFHCKESWIGEFGAPWLLMAAIIQFLQVFVLVGLLRMM